MATATTPRSTATVAPSTNGYEAIEASPPGHGWISFAGLMVLLAGVLNTIWGIAAIGNSKFFVANAHFVLSNLNTWGWIILGIGVLQICAAFSIWAGGRFGQWFGIGIAAVSAIGALMAIPAYPLWSLAIFAVDILVMYGLFAYGGDREIAA